MLDSELLKISSKVGILGPLFIIFLLDLVKLLLEKVQLLAFLSIWLTHHCVSARRFSSFGWATFLWLICIERSDLDGNEASLTYTFDAV